MENDIKNIAAKTFPRPLWIERIGPCQAIQGKMAEWVRKQQKKGKEVWRCRIGFVNLWYYANDIFSAIDAATKAEK